MVAKRSKALAIETETAALVRRGAASAKRRDTMRAALRLLTASFLEIDGATLQEAADVCEGEYQRLRYEHEQIKFKERKAKR